ncbi:MAG: ferritin-like domain-containing protein [Candidatus Eisenbacteria bacterium]
MLESSVREEIAGILAEADLEQKLARAEALTARADAIGAAPASSDGSHTPVRAEPPARPGHFRLLAPHEVPERAKLGSAAGRYALMHSVANIEFSAIELALLTAADFPGEPAEFHREWLGVAGEEVCHARMVLARLRALGGEFGDLPVHLGLWDTAHRFTRVDERLAIVPRILEARGLDVSARLRDQLHRAGDHESADLLEVIYRDEIGHVAAGTRWLRAVCARDGVDPEVRFLELLDRFRRERGSRPTPIDREGRARAGFSERELAALEGRSDLQ